MDPGVSGALRSLCILCIGRIGSAFKVVSTTEDEDTLCPNANWLTMWHNLLASTHKYTRCKLILVHCIYPL